MLPEGPLKGPEGGECAKGVPDTFVSASSRDADSAAARPALHTPPHYRAYIYIYVGTPLKYIDPL